MLQNIRDNSQGWIAKTIIGVIVALLALTGIDAIFTGTSNAQNAADVNGDKISSNELSQAVEMQRRQLLQQLGKNFDASMLDEKLLREAALKGLIERTLLLQSAQDANFSFSDAALDQVILQTPEFAVDGKFDANRFDQVIRQLGFNRMQFRQMLKQEMLIGQMRAGLAASSFVTDAEVTEFARIERQTRDFATMTIKADDAAVTLSDDDVKAYYEAQKSQFMSPEQVVLSYVELSKDSFFDQVKLDDKDLQDAYQAEIANLAEQRNAAHILVEVNDDTSDAEAKAKIEAVQKRLQAGEDFAALAKEVSQDPGSANEGGELGYAGTGVYDPAFEKSLYALKEGEVSAPVRSEFGWHLIKLLGVQSPTIPSFDSLKDKLVHDLKSQQVERRFVEVSKQLEDSAFEASDLAQPAEELGLKVQTTEAFGREGGAEGITANRQVLQAAFSPEILEDGRNSSVIELDPNTVVVVHLKEHKKSQQLTLEQVADSIRVQLAHVRATDAAKAQGDELIAAMTEGKTPVEQAGEGGWKVVEAATRNQEGVEPVVVQSVFRMPKPADSNKPNYAGVSLDNGDYVVIRLNGVASPSEPLTAEEKAAYARFLGSRAGQEDFAAFRKQLEAKADIERF
ncbi:MULTISPECIES: SurA N-terminal domain-containing protein [Pseudomonas]|jgi:peptidyl-prolyl cis-trans isomerase D|uniref:Periplasmic chaperone PpiD n=2 Tax=Pseudomonas marincola TaxID=437900 RepID=A0A1I7E851_9PSED|nr:MULTISPECIES: SurA N-terminal domain-containing protein [Pseudomonas]MBQ55956.1 peptidylprolyl isomerase [Pseudomonadaceae bacterium]OEO26164.1 peptidylprolyl isomerase [Pseudomonas sp. J237]CAE6922944.1 Peptidyl-prolyl cis-trans isomerase ppiD [Pseudomonas marincola]SFU20146.1 peptidyl-prolyl cis-trans isomerase D [Pseudomonas marincola]HCP55482.1 peptidylprolyl isomerase [Pseudomonas sp.]